MASALLQVEDLSHSYGGETAVKSISFEVPEGQFVTLVGPSGCGKTTTLKAVAGLLTPDAGSAIRIFGTDISHQPARKRPCSLVFQSLALFPHMTVEGNLRYPLAKKRFSNQEKSARILQTLALVGLDAKLLDRYPSQLSGGQKQRVALARSLIYDPKLLLLDEPLSSIDFQLRRHLRKTLSDSHRKSGKTFLYVTHSLEEALSLSDQIIVMNNGRILQKGSPDEIFSAPASRFVAEFMGDANVVRVSGQADSQSADGHPRAYRVEALDMTVRVVRHGQINDGFLVVRAHEVDLVRENTASNVVEVDVFNRYDLGGSIEYALSLPSGDLRLSCVMEKGISEVFSPGDRVYAQWHAQAGTVVPE